MAASRPVSSATIAVFSSAPTLWTDVTFPYPIVVPHSNHTVDAVPFGATLPASRACVEPTDSDADVVASGAAGTAVRAVRSAPTVVPKTLVATSR